MSAMTPVDQRARETVIVSSIMKVLNAAPAHQRLAAKSLILIDRHHVDPVPLLEGLARELPNSGRQEIWELIANYQAGDDLLMHFQQTRHVLPAGLVQALILARKDDYLAAIYQQISQADVALQERDFLNQTSGRLTGPLAKTLLVAWLVSFMMIKVVPELKSILDEFDLGNSRSFLLLNWISWFCYYLFFWVPLAMILCLLFLMVFRFRSFLSYLYRFSPSYWTLKSVPPSIARRQVLALMILAGGSIEKGFLGIRRSKSILGIFPRFDKIKESVQRQADVWSTLNRFWVISRREAVLLPQCSPQTQAWLLESNASNFSEASEAGRNIRQRGLIGVIHALLLILVFAVCSVVFLAVIDMIDELSKV